jgi:hypothetical protein
MPHYYFDSRDNEKFLRDDDGLHFDTIERARDQAAIALAEMAREVLPGSCRRELAIEVRDDTAAVLRTSLLFEALRLR